MTKKGEQFNCFASDLQAGGNRVDRYQKIRERADLDRLTDYFADVEEDFAKIKQKDTYQKQVDAAYEQLFDQLSQILQTDVRDREELCSILADFAAKCQEIYFKAGMAVGFQICRNLDMEYMQLKEEDFAAFMGCPDAGRGDLAGLPASFRNVKKP